MSRFTTAVSFLGENMDEAREKAQAWISEKRLVLDAYDAYVVGTYALGYYIATILHTPSAYLADLADAVAAANEAKAEMDGVDGVRASGTITEAIARPLIYSLAIAEVASRAQECLAAGYSKDRIIAITGTEMFEQANARSKNNDD